MKTISKTISKTVGLMLLLLVGANTTYATTISLGSTLAELNIENKGELVIAAVANGTEVSVNYIPWHSNTLRGKVHIVQYLAARTYADKMNKPFTNAVIRAKLPHNIYQVTTILNLNDALWGTSGIALRQLEQYKKHYQRSRFIADKTGQGLKAWGLAKKSSAIMVLDKNGRVVFFKDGALSEAEIQTTLALIRSHGVGGY